MCFSCINVSCDNYNTRIMHFMGLISINIDGSLYDAHIGDIGRDYCISFTHICINMVDEY